LPFLFGATFLDREWLFYIMVIGEFGALFPTLELESDFRGNYDIMRPFAAVCSNGGNVQLLTFRNGALAVKHLIP